VLTPLAGTPAKPTNGNPPLDELPVPEELLLELELLDDDELDELELLEELLELDELEELELEDDELLLDDEEELDEEDELELDELDDELELEDEPLGIEHSLVPPVTRVPAPKVDSWQRKLPLINLKVN
jgi:hypothetical protein